MPTYDLLGSKCNQIHEQSIPLSRIDEKVECQCQTEGCLAEIIILPRRLRTRSSTSIEPVVYFQNANGNVQVATGSDDPAPKGFERYEATSIADIYRLERRLNKIEMDKGMRWRENESKEWEEYQSQNRQELLQMINHGYSEMEYTYDEQGNPIDCKETGRTKMFSQEGKDMAMELMRQNNNRRSVYDERPDPGIHFDILYNDSKR